MRALTSAWRLSPHYPSRSPCFSPFTFRPFRLQPPHATLGPFLTPCTGSPGFLPRSPVLHEARGALFRGRFRFRHSLAGSSCTHSRIEFVKSYGLVFHLLLLSTPPRDDAVTIGYWFHGLPRRGLAPLWRTAFAGALAWPSWPQIPRPTAKSRWLANWRNGFRQSAALRRGRPYLSDPCSLSLIHI